MLHNKTIAVIVSAYNEESQINAVLDAIPEFVDRIIVVNDKSNDNTESIIEKYLEDNHSELVLPNIDPKAQAQYTVPEQYYPTAEVVNTSPDSDRIILINHKKNEGPGGSVTTGYKWALEHNIDCIATIDGDGQMDISELESVCTPILNEEVDYAKGNRLIHRSALLIIPKLRFFGNSILSIFTKIASGYWQVSDTQTGFTAISKRALQSIHLHKIYKGYGYPNDLLVKLNIAYCSITEVEISPVYDVGEKSKMNILKVVPKISLLLLKSFFKRLWIKYFLRDFHPLFLLYHISFFIGMIWTFYIWKVGKALVYSTNLSFETLFAFTFLGVICIQSFLFAMWMDIQDNQRLFK